MNTNTNTNTNMPWGTPLAHYTLPNLPQITAYVVASEFEDAGYTRYYVAGASLDTLEQALVFAIAVSRDREDMFQATALLLEL